MERLKCKTCSSFAMVPMAVSVDAEDVPSLGGAQESHFYTCHVCGDNWLSVREETGGGDSQVTYIHQMGMTPVLKRVAHVQQVAQPVATQKGALKHWEYYLDEHLIDERLWREKLLTRRQILKSICSN